MIDAARQQEARHQRRVRISNTSMSTKLERVYSHARTHLISHIPMPCLARVTLSLSRGHVLIPLLLRNSLRVARLAYM